MHCVDGKLYVWQIETGSLDRCVDGETARTILSNTPETTPTPSERGDIPLQVRTVSVSPRDSSIQVRVTVIVVQLYVRSHLLYLIHMD